MKNNNHKKLELRSSSSSGSSSLNSIAEADEQHIREEINLAIEAEDRARDQESEQARERALAQESELTQHLNNFSNQYDNHTSVVMGKKTKEAQKNIRKIKANMGELAPRGEFEIMKDSTGVTEKVHMSKSGIQSMAHSYFQSKGIKASDYIMVDQSDSPRIAVEYVSKSLKAGESKIIILSSGVHSIPMVLHHRKSSKTSKAKSGDPKFLCILADKDASKLANIGENFAIMQPKDAIRDPNSYNHEGALPLAEKLFTGITTGEIEPEKLFKKSSAVRISGDISDMYARTKVVIEYPTPNRIKALSENRGVQKKASGIKNLIAARRNNLVSKDLLGKNKYNPSLNNKVASIVRKNTDEELRLINEREKQELADKKQKPSKPVYKPKPSKPVYKSGSFWHREGHKPSSQLPNSPKSENELHEQQASNAPVSHSQREDQRKAAQLLATRECSLA